MCRPRGWWGTTLHRELLHLLLLFCSWRPCCCFISVNEWWPFVQDMGHVIWDAYQINLTLSKALPVHIPQSSLSSSFAFIYLLIVFDHGAVVQCHKGHEPEWWEMSLCAIVSWQAVVEAYDRVSLLFMVRMCVVRGEEWWVLKYKCSFINLKGAPKRSQKATVRLIKLNNSRGTQKPILRTLDTKSFKKWHTTRWTSERGEYRKNLIWSGF